MKKTGKRLRRAAALLLSLCLSAGLLTTAALASDAPAAPTNLRFEIEPHDPKQEMYIKWDAVEPPAGYQYVEYQVERYHNGEPAYAPGVDPYLTTLKVLPFTVAKNPEDGYSFRVRARGINVLGDIDNYAFSTPAYLGEPGPWGPWAEFGGNTQGSEGAETPAITGQPQDATYSLGAKAAPLTVTATGGSLSYQWMVMVWDDNAPGGGGYVETPIEGATGPSYTPPTDKAGSTYYTCWVTVQANEGESHVIMSRNAKITVTGEPPVVGGFTDVKKTDWFCDAVEYVVEQGLFSGVSDTSFAPNDPITRGMLVTVLWRAAGEPPRSSDVSFFDIDPFEWYGEAVRWAASEGIADGYGNGFFGTDDRVTREQMATILYRYAQNKGYNVSAKADLNKFTDVGKISSYALEALQWANAEGLINGKGDSVLDPKGQATRAEAAAILMRFSEDVAN